MPAMLSTAVAKEIYKKYPRDLVIFSRRQHFAAEILEKESWKGIGKSRYTNDKQITDHYAIIPTGQEFGALRSVSMVGQQVYEVIVRRF